MAPRLPKAPKSPPPPSPPPLPGPPPRERQVVSLAETPYTVQELLAAEVILRWGKALERGRRVDVPNKGYAICIEGLEYEFQGVLK